MKASGFFQHLVLGFTSTLLSLYLHSSIAPAIYVMLTVELTQADCFGQAESLPGRILAWFLIWDTWLDLIADTIGLSISLFVLALLEKMT